MNEATLQEITKYVTAKKEVVRKRCLRVFLFHLLAYVLANLFLGGWNALTYYVKGDKTLWFFLPLIFWGVALLIHYVNGVVLIEQWWKNDERYIAGQWRG